VARPARVSDVLGDWTEYAPAENDQSDNLMWILSLADLGLCARHGAFSIEK
jgi:hypothetical protein